MDNQRSRQGIEPSVPGAPPDPRAYDAWYAGARGAWIGDLEYRTLADLLQPRPGETLLDVGAGTGYFTRRFAARAQSGWTVAADLDFAAARHASRAANQPALAADACSLPFADRSFDLVLSVTALCFVPDIEAAIAEMRRVARRRIALGLLNRHGLLYRSRNGRGAYCGARWHTPSEVELLMGAGGTAGVDLRSAVMLPQGGAAARVLEPLLARLTPRHGSFIAAAADVGAAAKP